MHFRKLLIICLWAVCLFAPGQLISGQGRGTVSGTVNDAASGQPLIGVNIGVDQGGGTATDRDGNYTLTLDTGPHSIVFSYLGYKEGDFPISEEISRRIFSLPMHPYLTEEEQQKIAEVIGKKNGCF